MIKRLIVRVPIEPNPPNPTLSTAENGSRIKIQKCDIASDGYCIKPDSKKIDTLYDIFPIQYSDTYLVESNVHRLAAEKNNSQVSAVKVED